ncbi:MAG: type II toxin-antitoxin system RelE/ParE family toxin [Sphingorhabdus sp.]|nr:type II toxin-antitoxin system RelE/ParE family toxin [Sphingorhabdus sp.]
MRIYKNAWFAKFSRKEKIDDDTLCNAIRRAEQGLIDADLGSGLLKQRVAREGAGKSGGYRTLIFFRSGERAIFAFGFAKSEKTNLNTEELAEFRKAAKEYLAFSQHQIDRLVQIERLTEVSDGDEDL